MSSFRDDSSDSEDSPRGPGSADSSQEHTSGSKDLDSEVWTSASTSATSIPNTMLMALPDSQRTSVQAALAPGAAPAFVALGGLINCPSMHVCIAVQLTAGHQHQHQGVVGTTSSTCCVWAHSLSRHPHDVAQSSCPAAAAKPHGSLRLLPLAPHLTP